MGSQHGMRLAITAAGIGAGQVANQAFLFGGNPPEVFHHGLVQQDEGLGNGGPALHGQYAIGRKTQGLIEKARQFGHFSIMVLGQGVH